MCNLYESTPRDKINARHLVQLPLLDYAKTIAPLKPGPFVMANGVSAVGQWGMIPPNSTTRKPMTTTGRPLSTNNARRETLSKAWTYRFPWARGQRCLIPCDSFDEPFWGTGKNVWWRFWRSDGEPWALAGIWSEWTVPSTGEVVPNYSMITQNCDAHPLMRLMHRPDPKLPADAQDKRAVVPVEREDWDEWLHGTQDQAEALIGLPTMECIRHAAADPAKAVALPL